MDSASIQARIEHEAAELRALYPQISSLHSALVQWNDGGKPRYSLHLDVRWPQRQAIISGTSQDNAHAAIMAAMAAARERLDEEGRR